MAKNTILIVDDEASMRRILSALLTQEGYNTVVAENGKVALQYFKRDYPTVVLADLKMPEMDGLELLAKLTALSPITPVIMITAYGTVELAVTAMKMGAYDFILKPFDKAEIKAVIQKVIRIREKNINSFLITPGDEDLIIGNSVKMQEIYQLIEKVSKSVATVCILGESGTGKELVARALHYHSPRKNKPFIKVNCAAIPETLLESELFGYEKGAFTGALIGKPGRFELAHEGSLFLDEIADMSLNNQTKLFRVIQERAFERVGGIRTINVDIRLIVAASMNLQEYVASGRFREELYYRLNVVSIHLPPLRQRKEDIVALIDYFIVKFNQREGKTVEGVSAEAMKAMMHYDWPGNIRELENVVERMLVLEDSQWLQADKLPENFVNHSAKTLEPLSLKEYNRREKTEKERELIISALQQTNGNRTKAAMLLKTSRRSLQMKIKEYNLNHIHYKS